MILGIMQPYFFPYIGYWQLINTVDKFIIYDNVNYIKSGWINRNRILINGKPTYITIPLSQASSFKHICDISVNNETDWRGKLTKTIETTYRRAPYFESVFPMISHIINNKNDNLSEYLTYQLRTLCTFMGITTEIVVASQTHPRGELFGKERVIDICKKEKADTYINAQGGQELYDAQSFNKEGIDLKFMDTTILAYPQRLDEFITHLSIVDLLMNSSREDLMLGHLPAYELIKAK
jgi:hypothetical protein